MTDIQYLILDELYFVTNFSTLLNAVDLASDRLKDELIVLIQNEWVKILDNDRDYELDYEPHIFSQNFDSYYYLATKKGLFEHNSQ